MPVPTKASLAALGLFLLTVATPGAAAEFKLLVAPEGAVELSRVQFNPQPKELVVAGNGHVTYDLGLGVTSLRTVVSVDEPPAQKARFEMTLNLPYFWQEEDVMPEVAVALASERVSQDEIDELMRTGDGKLSSRSGQVWLNRQTRNALSDLRGEEHFPNETDVKILYFFVSTSTELVLTGYVEPDNEMKDAVKELSDILAERAHLFEDDKAKLDAKLAIERFAQARRTQLNAVVLRVSEDVGRAQNDVNCSRSRTLFEFFDKLSNDGRSSLDPNGAFENLNLSALSMCLARDLKADAQISAEQLKDSLSVAARVQSRFGQTLPLYEASIRPGDTRAGHASQSKASIEDFLRYHHPED